MTTFIEIPAYALHYGDLSVDWEVIGIMGNIVSVSKRSRRKYVPICGHFEVEIMR